MPEDPPLYGHVVLVTRPAHQAGALCDEIEKVGGNTVRCPAIEILPPRDARHAQRQLKQIKNFDLAIFVSVNAVEAALTLLAPVKLPKTLQLAAIGISTTASLQSRGYQNIIHPQQQFDSEGLLQTETFRNVAGKRIALIRGESGREWLTKRLEENGASVTSIAAYRRKKPRESKTVLNDVLKNGEITLLSVTSNEGLRNITEMSGHLRARLQGLPMVVLSERNRQHAIKLGYGGPIQITELASNQYIVKALVKLADSMRYR